MCVKYKYVKVIIDCNTSTILLYNQHHAEARRYRISKGAEGYLSNIDNCKEDPSIGVELADSLSELEDSIVSVMKGLNDE